MILDGSFERHSKAVLAALSLFRGVQKRLPLATALALLVASFLVRLDNLNSPLVEAHSFRQTQTAFTVWCFIKDGISLLDPQMPALGPPWRVPFECPIYQATAALLIKATGMDIDAGCRLTSILYFYFSAFLLFEIVRLFAGLRPAMLSLLVYVWSPLTFLWSRACLPEFAAVTFTLAYVFFFFRWLRNVRCYWLLSLAILAGSLGALAKVTTVAVGLPAIVFFMAKQIRTPRTETRRASSLDLERWAFMLACVAVLFVPVLAAKLWTDHADHIKAASTATAWLTSSRLSSWNYGTLEQRAHPSNWLSILGRIPESQLPYGFAVAAGFALVFARRSSSDVALFLYSMAAGVALPICVFFNLYLVHDYYYSAISPCLAVLAGFGINHLNSTFFNTDRRGRIPFMGIFIVSLWLDHSYFSMSLASRFGDPMYLLGKAARKVTSPDEYIAVTDEDWNPEVLYYAKRRGYMIMHDPRMHYARLKTDKITTVVTPDQNDAILKTWSWHRIIGQVGRFFVVKVRN